MNSETVVDRLHIAANSCDFMNLPHNAGTIREAAAEIERLEREIEALRSFGNKDCTAMADDWLEEQANEQ